MRFRFTRIIIWWALAAAQQAELLAAAKNQTNLMETKIHEETPVTGEMIALLTVLALFTVVGSVGNGLVLFVFSRVRDKTTAQLFILALALIDLFTCMVIIPLTMFAEYTRYDIKYDFLCKLYQFLITSKVPLSAFIMVAIAFDRYFCICHPLRKIITPWRTKVIIVCLTLFASTLGVMTSLAYGVYQLYDSHDPKHLSELATNLSDVWQLTTTRDTTKDWAQFGDDPSTKSDIALSVDMRMREWQLSNNLSALYKEGRVIQHVYIGICAPNEILLDLNFFYVYQKCYTALFLVCLVIVGILYGMIYRFIGMRRSKKLQQRLVLCAYVNGENGCGEPGTRTTLINGNGHDDDKYGDKYGCNGQGLGAGGVYIGGCTSPVLPFQSKSPGVGGTKDGGGGAGSKKEEGRDKLGEKSQNFGEDDGGVLEGKKLADDFGGFSHSDMNGDVACSKSLEAVQMVELKPLRKTSSDKFIDKNPSPDNSPDPSRPNSDTTHPNITLPDPTRPDPTRPESSHQKSLVESKSGPASLGDHRSFVDIIPKVIRRGSSSHAVDRAHDADGRRHARRKRRESEPLPKGAYEVSFLDNLTGHKVPYLETSIEEDVTSAVANRTAQPPQVIMLGCPSPSSDNDPPSSGDSNTAVGCFQPCAGERTSTTAPHNTSTTQCANWTPLGDPDLSVFTSQGIVVTSPSWNDLLCGASLQDTMQSRPVNFGTTNLAEYVDEDDPSSPLLQCDVASVEGRSQNDVTLEDGHHDVKFDTALRDVKFETAHHDVKFETDRNDVKFETVPKQSHEFHVPLKKVSNYESSNATESRFRGKGVSENEEVQIPLLTTESDFNHKCDNVKDDFTHKVRLNSNDFEKDKATSTNTTHACNSDTVFVYSKDADNNTLQLNNRNQQSNQNQQCLLTAYVRNVTPRISTSSSVISVEDGPSRCSTMEGTARRPNIDDSRRLTVETYIDRRSTMESRTSTMDSGSRRPTNQRKKRWQHFRSKNASIKGSHNRGHGSSAGGARRSILPYDAERLREENRAANARTALMLFTVTVVFVVAFLPAWLMAHRLIPTQLIVFYLYFTYNVANPFIYAFMNVIFKEHLRKIFGCKSRR